MVKAIPIALHSILFSTPVTYKIDVMHKNLLFTALMMLGALYTNAQTFVHDFQKEFNYGTNPLLISVMNKTTDGGFVVVSSTAVQTGSGSAQDDIVLYKLNTNYDITFQIRYDISSLGGVYIFARDVIQRRNGGYAICGQMGSATHGDGGFLLLVKSNGTIEHFKFYPTDYSQPETIIRTDKVLEGDFGYVMIGTGINQSSQTRGLIMSTFPNGDILWTKHVHDQQYMELGKYNINSELFDLAKGKKNEFLAVGGVNGSPSEDQDLIVLKFTEFGDILGNWVYERQGKTHGDGQLAFLDLGTAITYNPARNSILVAGYSLQAPETSCTVADIRHLLTIELDNPTGNVNWSHTHDLDPTQFPDRTFHADGIEYNENMNEYGICGYRMDDAFNPGGMQNMDGFVTRLNVNGTIHDTRIYGDDTNEYFNSIEKGTTPNGYTVCGTKENQLTWITESYENLTEQCRQVELMPETMVYPLQSHPGYERLFSVTNLSIAADLQSSGIKAEVICNKQGVSIDPGPGGLGPAGRIASEENGTSFVYPVPAKEYLNLVNNEAFGAYTIYSVNGSQQLRSDNLVEGVNRIDLKNLQEGLYIILLSDNNGRSKTLKFTVK